MHLIENLSPVNPISFRKQPFWNSRHKSSLLGKKYHLQIYHFVGTQRRVYGKQDFLVQLCSLYMNSEVQANLLHVEELLDANKVDECSLWDTVILGQCKYLLFCSLLHPNSSINGSAMPSHAFIFVYPMPPKSVQHGTSTRCLCTANSNKLTNCPRGTIMTASMH